MFLRVREWPLPTLFWADKDLPRKLLIAERRTEFCVQFRRNEKQEKHEIGEECCRSRLQRQSEGCSSKQRRAGQGAPGPLHDTSLHQQAGLTGSQQDISHSGLIWDQKDPARPLYHLHFQHKINAWKQHWNYPLYFLWLPRSRQKNGWKQFIMRCHLIWGKCTSLMQCHGTTTHMLNEWMQLWDTKF